MTPNDQQSHLVEYCSFFNTSGAIYSGEPHVVTNPPYIYIYDNNNNKREKKRREREKRKRKGYNK